MLARAGLLVFWDRRLEGGDFKDELTRRIDEAGCVVVCGSRSAAASHYVQWETNLRPGKILGCVLDDVSHDQLPVELRGQDVLDLRNWNGEWDHPSLSKLIMRVWAKRADALVSLHASASGTVAQSAGLRNNTFNGPAQYVEHVSGNATANFGSGSG